MDAIATPVYFTNASRPGASVRYRELPGSIGVLESLENGMPIGMASEAGRNDAGLAMWTLRVHGVNVPGRWVIVDRRFVLEPGPG